MSWLSGLTGNVEELLNKIDQSAAGALKNENETGYASGNVAGSKQSDHTADAASSRQYVQNPSPIGGQGTDKSSPYVTKPIRHTLTGLSKSPSTPLQANIKQVSSPSPVQKPQTGAVSSVSSPQQPTVATSGGKKKIDSDEALFDFLNSSDPVEATRKKSITPISSARHSRQSSTSSTISSKGTKSTDAPPSTSGSSIVHIDSAGPGSERESPNSEPDGLADVAALADAMLEQSPSNSVHSNQGSETAGEAHQKMSSLELENKLLKNEVASLNQEMSSIIQRSRDSVSELEKTKQKLDSYHRSASMHDQLVRELQSRESDLTEALGAKDSQLAVLRVRLEEADKELTRKASTVQNLESHRNRILQDHTDSSGMHSQALDTLKAKLVEVEAALKREQEAYKQAQQEASDRQGRLEVEQRSLAEALTTSERRFNEEKAKVSEISIQMKTLKSNADLAKQELTEYKEKATRILQSKERLIASLREGSGAAGEMAGVSSLEYDSIKQERDMFRDELQQSRMTVDSLRVELQDLEGQLQRDSDEANDQLRALEDNLLVEKRRRKEAETELLKQKQEMQYSIEEIHKQKGTFQNCVRDRELEIEKLRNQLATKSMSSTSENELESRVKSLTESLIQKQTVLEALSTEKNSLNLQLERLEMQYKDVQASSLRTNTAVVHVNDDEEVRQRLPAFMRETATDTEVTKKMKRAANSIDKLGIRLGVFLRRYPIARVFVILYMAMLHLWVMVVLLTYQPEMHGADHGQPLPPPGAH
ncbi:golgin subfamily A member 5-like isoform X2 [Mizuhopecten yessoensis]|uniref:Golgin subfamily A member 5 n=1 Tax=Mizuhopecten yessoensis TaxID=6573 RepID=A0A210Q510_MIZYE|nr:golgin subfamily A member 5-like isoform X2 [Mizuhopecten yessoensis]OWF43826.1 Golgin subfamily A member 5 [Mizuhopecten yessoensis]